MDTDTAAAVPADQKVSAADVAAPALDGFETEAGRQPAGNVSPF
ncbi:hypothetical protein [Streptomyces sp. NPDC055189]